MRHDENALCARGAELLQRFAHRGLRVEHAELNGERREDPLRKGGGEIRAQTIRVHDER